MKAILVKHQITLNYQDIVTEVRKFYVKEMAEKEICDHATKIVHSLEVVMLMDEDLNIKIDHMVGSYILGKKNQVKYPGIYMKVDRGYVNLYLKENGKSITFLINDHPGIPIFYTFNNIEKRYNKNQEPQPEPVLNTKEKSWSNTVKSNLWLTKSSSVSDNDKGKTRNIDLVNMLFNKLQKIDHRHLIIRPQTHQRFVKFCQNNSTFVF